MKNQFKCLMAVLITFFLAANVFSQEWTKAQLEVWQVVEDSWALSMTNDVQAMVASIHSQYQGWNDRQPLPMTKQMVIEDYQRSIDHGDKMDYYSLNPARIVITNNAAVVDYYFVFQVTFKDEDEENEKITISGQNAEFYIKENGKWMLLGDMTTIKSKKD